VATSLVQLSTWSVAVFRDLLPGTVGERAVATVHPGVALLPGTVGERAVATGVALLPGTVGERAIATGHPGVAFLLHGVLCASAVAVLHVARSAAVAVLHVARSAAVAVLHVARSAAVAVLHVARSAAVAVLHVARSAAVAVHHVARSVAFMLFLCGTVLWLHCVPCNNCKWRLNLFIYRKRQRESERNRTGRICTC
jgi:hypothetical protein